MSKRISPAVLLFSVGTLIGGLFGLSIEKTPPLRHMFFGTPMCIDPCFEPFTGTATVISAIVGAVIGGAIGLGIQFAMLKRKHETN